MANFNVKLGQVFSVYGAYTPTKASVFLKPVNVVSGSNAFNISYYDPAIPFYGAIMDALNFSSIAQSDMKLIASDGATGYTGNGFLSSVSADVFPVGAAKVYYPIQATSSGTFRVWLRLNTDIGNIQLDVSLDGASTSSISDPVSVVGSWVWYSTTIYVPDDDIHVLEIAFVSMGTFLDQLYIAPVPSAVPVGAQAFTTSPFVTISCKVYNVDANSLPTTPLYIYDYKTSLTEIRSEDWYNFDLNFLDSRWAVPFDSEYALILFASGHDTNKYILWDFVAVDPYDPYGCGPSLIKTAT